MIHTSQKTASAFRRPSSWSPFIVKIMPNKIVCVYMRVRACARHEYPSILNIYIIIFDWMEHAREMRLWRVWNRNGRTFVWQEKQEYHNFSTGLPFLSIVAKAKFPPPGPAPISLYSAHTLFSCFALSYNKQFPFPYTEFAVCSL